MIDALRKFAALAALLLVWPCWAAEPVRLGVLAYPVKPWLLVADELKRRIPERDFVVEILDHAALEQAVASRRLDFVLTNGGHYLQIKRGKGLSSPLATLVNDAAGQPMTVFGGTIVCAAGRKDITRLQDLRGKTVAYTDFSAQGGFQVQAYELALAGLDPRHDLNLLRLGLPHERSIEAVLTGKADAAFVRAGLIEDMAAGGRLDSARLQVLNRQDLPGYPWVVSTHLFPEWVLAALPQTDEDIARRVTAAMLELDRNPALMQALKIHGFTVPADYTPMEELLWKLHLPPFDSAVKFTLADVWQKYRWQLIAVMFLLVVVGLLSFRLLFVNHRLLALQKSLVASEKRYRAIFDHAAVGIAQVSPDGNVLEINPVFCDIIGYPGAEVLTRGFNLRLIAYPDDLAQESALIQNLLDKDAAHCEMEMRYLRKDGELVWGHLSLALVRDEVGQPLYFIHSLIDISERKHAEHALQRSNADLERFAYSVSHDMRQPLRAVSGHLQLLVRSLKERLDEEERKNLEFALDGAQRMDSMILSLLEYSRVGRKTEARTRMSSRESLEEALEFLEPMRMQSEGRIEVSGEWPEVQASRDELTRLFQNLIGNGLHYHEAGVAPSVEVESEVVGGHWRVRVRDHGIGIAPEQIDRLFQFFSRLQARTKFDGTGMGLALCRRIVELHGGRIWVESAGEGQGSTFCFELPIEFDKTPVAIV